MAAQSLVRRSFVEPRETYETNVMGTVNVLDAVRLHGSGVRAIVNVTSDKCYENREWEWGYREDEPMGGHDPYSSSKGCAELVDGRLPPLVLRRRRRAAPRLRARGQRDRRRRLGRGPARAGHHARGARRRAGARAQPELDPPLAARAQPAQRLPGAGPGAVGAAGAGGGLELRPGRGGRPSGRLDRASGSPQLWPEELRWVQRRRAPPARGALPEARLLQGPRPPRLAPAARPGGDAREHRRLVQRAARRARTCAR